MRLNEYCSKQYIEILETEDGATMAFFDTEEDWRESEEVCKEDGTVILYHGYVTIADCEICEHPDFELFIKNEFIK